jgi:hypothetical protein
MTKLILILALVTGLWADKYPKDVTGKWAVDNVEVGDLGPKIPAERKDMMIIMMKETFKNAIFTLGADHRCSVSVNVPNMPQNSTWEYNPANGLITITNVTKDQKKLSAQIQVTDKGGKIFFTMKAAPVILQVHKM